MNLIESQRKLAMAWSALEMSPTPWKTWRPALCTCDPDCNAVPCEYCALFDGLKCAERMLEMLDELKAVASGEERGLQNLAAGFDS